MPDSKNFLKTYSAYLSEDNHRQFFVPRGFAHGFLATEHDTIFQYKCDNLYNKESEGSFLFSDVKDFDWGYYVPNQLWLVSEKDANAKHLDEKNFDCFNGITTNKRYKELDLNKVKEILTPDFHSFDKSYDYESQLHLLKLCVVQFKDNTEGKIVDVHAIYDLNALMQKALIVEIDGQPKAVTADGFDNILRIYYP